MPFPTTGRITLTVTALLLSASCAPTVKSAAREASSAAVEQSVQEVSENKGELAKAAQDPRIEAATTNLADQITEGVLRALESDRARSQLTKLTELTASTATREMLDTLGSEQARQQLASAAGSVTQSTAAQLASALNTQLAPAFKQALAGDVARGMAGALHGAELHDALGATAQNVAYHAVLGAEQGMGAVWTGADGVAREARNFGRATLPWLWLGFAALAAFTLALVSAAVIALARARRARLEVSRLESATLLLATAMRERHVSTEADELMAVVQDSLQRSAQLHEHRGLFGALKMRGHN